MFIYLAYKFYRDFYVYDRSCLNYKVIVPAILFVGYIGFSLIYGPYELMVDLNDKGFRRNGLFTQLLPVIGLLLASFPYQVSEFSNNHLKLSKNGLNSIYRWGGWLMFLTATVRNLLVVA